MYVHIVYIYIYIYVYLSLSIHTYIYIYIHTTVVSQATQLAFSGACRASSGQWDLDIRTEKSSMSVAPTPTLTKKPLVRKQRCERRTESPTCRCFLPSLLRNYPSLCYITLYPLISYYMILPDGKLYSIAHPPRRLLARGVQRRAPRSWARTTRPSSTPGTPKKPSPACYRR